MQPVGGLRDRGAGSAVRRALSLRPRGHTRKDRGKAGGGQADAKARGPYSHGVWVPSSGGAVKPWGSLQADDLAAGSVGQETRDSRDLHTRHQSQGVEGLGP